LKLHKSGVVDMPAQTPVEGVKQKSEAPVKPNKKEEAKS